MLWVQWTHGTPWRKPCAPQQHPAILRMLTCTIATWQPCSVHEGARARKLAAFAAAGFRRRAAVLVLPDPELFARQRQQHATNGKSVDQLTMAEMRGARGVEDATVQGSGRASSGGETGIALWRC